MKLIGSISRLNQLYDIAKILATKKLMVQKLQLLQRRRKIAKSSM